VRVARQKRLELRKGFSPAGALVDWRVVQGDRQALLRTLSLESLRL
jgi:hypothetical protein